jgi:3',5'-cyclic AMP phosphodiesterase CpdA
MYKPVLWLNFLLLSACGAAPLPAPPAPPPVASPAANCDLFAPDPFVLRNELAPGSRSPGAQLLLRFVHFSDDHIIDDDGQAINGASATDPLHPTFESAMRLQEEYADEVLNDLIGRVNTCHQAFPAEFMLVTGDSADLTTIAETRRFIDNLDGTFDQMSAFEIACRAGLPEGTPEPLAVENCTRYTGRGVADTHSPDPDISDPQFQFLPTRTLRQLLATQAAAASGRAEDGSTDPQRQTVTRSPGLPQPLRCTGGETGCINQALDMPWYVAFGNHDAYARGTLTGVLGLNEASQLTGRRYMLEQHEFIDEFFQTTAQPGPVGHGFNFVEAARMQDDDGRNDGYYAFDAGAGRLRMIVLNTIVDGLDARIPLNELRNPFGLADGGLEAAQFEWLKTELEAALQRQQLVLVFSHHPDLSFVEFGSFADGVNIEVTAAQLNAELASYPNFIAWVAGHTHRHRVRAFRVDDEGMGSNGVVSAAVSCKGPGPCSGFWQIETASLIDFPQEQRLIEIFDNRNGTGTLRGPVLTHGFERARPLAEADDRCQLYLSDPAAVEAAISEADLAALCLQGGTRFGEPGDRNVELMFRMPAFSAAQR